MIEKIVKRDGAVVPFDKNKIGEAIWKAAQSIGGRDRELAFKLADEVVEFLEKNLKPGEIPTVEQVQDAVEKILVENGHYRTAKSYITYRKMKEEIRKEKVALLGEFYEEKVAKRFSINAIRLMVNRYLQKNEKGEIIEGPKQMFERVAMLVVIPDILYDTKIFDKNGKQKIHEKQSFNPEDFDRKIGLGKKENGFAVTWNKYHLERMKALYDELNEKGHMKVSWNEFWQMLQNGEFDNYYENFLEYYNLMIDKKFLPNSPTLFNAGAPLGQLSACFVIDIDDDMESIMDSAKQAALIFKSGGGIGINYSKLRPEGDRVSSTGGTASGPVSFMRIIDTVTDVVKQGGKRRGANMGILEVWHPDIMKFIHAKDKEGEFENFNISVMLDQAFWDAWKKNERYPLINPRKNKTEAYLDPRKFLEEVSYLAWKTGDPGLLFKDNINRRNVMLESKGEIRATNPCVTGDTLVITDHGLIKAKELKENMKVFTLNGWVRIEEVLNNGVQDVYEVELENGMKIKVTKDHKFLTENGWKKLEDIKESEKIRIVVEDIDYENSSPLHEKFAEFLGYWVGDGSLSISNHVRLHVGKEKSLANYFADYLNDIAGHAFIVNFDNQFIVDTHRKEFAEKIREIAKIKVSKSQEKRVPEIIFTSEKKAQAAFLRGLFTADGSVYNANGSVTISLSSTSRKLLEEIQILLASFGIYSVLTSEKSKPTYRLLISGKYAYLFKKKIGFIGEKNKKLEKFFKEKTFYEKDKKFIKIKSIKHIGKEEVFDIKAPPVYTWVTNGIYSYDCGEEPLYPYESCNLGSINLYAFIKEDENGKAYFDWEEYNKAIKIAYRFLDNVIDVNKFPLPEIEKETKARRKIGLGIMGLADALYALKLPYSSEEGFDFTRKVCEHLTYFAMLSSAERAKERGSFPEYEKSAYIKGGMPVEGYYHKELWSLNWEKLKEMILANGIRNVEVTTIAPTGSISMFFDVSSGIEPQFSLVFEKRVVAGEFYYVDIEFEKQLKKNGLYKEEILKKISENGGSVQGLEEIPEEMKKVFVTALDLPWWDHIRAQAVAQLWITTSISKTINMPEWVSSEDVHKAYVLAHEMGCKGITIYREGSKSKQVIYLPGEVSHRRIEEVIKLIKNETPKIMKKLGIEMPDWYKEILEHGRIKSINNNNNGKCPNCGSENLISQGGCLTCSDCGWSKCVIA